MTRTLNWLLVAAVLAALWLRDPLLAVLALLLGLLAGLTALWDRYALAGVTYVRRLDTPRLFVGEETDLTIEITNAKPLPLAWLKAEDEFPAEMSLARGRIHHSHKPTRRLLTNLLALRFYERVRKRYHLRAEKRGVLAFGPVELRAGDLFGFRRQEHVIERIDELVVYPRIVPVTTLSLPANYPSGDTATRRRIADDPLRTCGARPYVAGDNPRYLHWKTTARRGDLHSKIFEPGATPRTAIFLDVTTVHGMPGIVEEYLEFAIIAAASVARWLLDRREAVGLYSNTARRNSSELVRLPPSRRPERWTEILDSLARVIEIPSVALERLVRAELPALPYGTTVIAISATPDPALYAALLDVQRANHPVALLAIGETAPPDVPAELRCTWIGGRTAYRGLEELDLRR